MANTLYKSLRDDYDRRDGRTTDYVGANLDLPIDNRTHYDIRAFWNTDITIPWTIWDMRFWNASHFSGMTMDELSARRSLSGRTFRRRIMVEMNALNMGDLNGESMDNINFVTVSVGNEEWLIDPAVTVGKDAAYRYMNTIRVTLDDGVSKTVDSHYHDDLLANFNDPGTEYYIELALPGFPGQSTSAARLDLNNSYIDFSSSDTFEAAVTDSVRLNESLNDLSAGGDTYFRINRSRLVNADIQNIAAIRFRLLAKSAPFAASTGVRNPTAGALVGTYDYKVTFVNGGVESLASPATTPITTGLVEPSSWPLLLEGAAGALNGTYQYAVSFYNASGETLATQPANEVESEITVSNKQINLTSIPLGVAGTTGRRIYRKTMPAGTFGLVATIADNTTTTHTDNNTTPGAAPPGSNTAGQRIDLSNIPIGPTGTTQRKIYRAASSAPIYPGAIYPGSESFPSPPSAATTYNLVTTIADNTTTTFTDNVTALGGEPPATSNLGDMTFRAAAMRLIPGSYLWEEIDTDTKRGNLVRSVPRAGAPEPGSAFGMVYFDETRPDDVVLYAKFNSGHNPVGNDNEITFDFHYSDQDQDSTRVRFLSRSTQSRLRIYNVDNNVETEVYSTPINTNILTEETEYYLVIQLEGTLATATVYEANGLYLGAQVYTTGVRTVALNRRGHVGYDFRPYNYDFTLDWISALNAEFAHFQSKTFPSISPVIGATLITKNSPAINMIENLVLEASGDSAITTASIGTPTPSLKVDRVGTGWFGGIEQVDEVIIGNSRQVTISGDIYPIGQVRGLYRVVLVDTHGSVGFIGHISGLLPNQWNHFDVPVAPNLTPTEFRLFIHQAGFYNDEFYLDNVAINHSTIAWDASADNGANWQPFLTAINGEHTGIRFNSPGTQLKVRATAYSDEAWIHGYELVPRYGSPGRPTSYANTAREVRITGRDTSARTNDVRVTAP